MSRTLSASSPLPSLRTGGASPVKNDGPTVAGTSPSSRAGYSGMSTFSISSPCESEDSISKQMEEAARLMVVLQRSGPRCGDSREPQGAGWDEWGWCGGCGDEGEEDGGQGVA